MKLIIIECDDWEAMYLDDECIWQHHHMDRYDFIKLMEKYNLKPKDIYSFWADEEDEKYAYDYGQFPNKLSELKGDYSI